MGKWAGFPDIKLLEPLAECLDVTLIELMQSEKTGESRIDREEALCLRDFLSVLCGTASICILWRSSTIREVKIGRHKVKGLLTILMDMLVVFLLHTYMSNIANNQQQLLMLPEAIPVNAYMTTADGSRQSGIFIKDELVQGFLESEYVDNLKMDIRLKAGINEVIPGEWSTLNLYLQGVNGIEAIGGIEESDVVWNTGEDASFLQGTEAKCIVSKQLFEKNGWKLGDKITLCEYYYYRPDERERELFMDSLFCKFGFLCVV